MTKSDIKSQLSKTGQVAPSDAGGIHEVFVKIVNGYEALKDPRTRMQIDIQECRLPGRTFLPLTSDVVGC